MMILGIDTSTATASVALVEDGKLVCEEALPGQKKFVPFAAAGRSNHGETLLPLVDAVVKIAGLSIAGLSALAVSIGPGSFTGLRIGLSTAKGLAYGSDLPVVGVPTLLAVARRADDWQGIVCPFLDARKNEVYAALFRRENETLERLTEDGVSAPERVLERARSLAGGERCLFIGDGIGIYAEKIENFLGRAAFLDPGDSYPSTASAVARVGEEMLRQKRPDSLGAMVPLYLRSSEAELRFDKTSASSVEPLTAPRKIEGKGV
jgi:tRNA threonylcarbamoyladenosine biosynthesis protein TsaB